jgi:uncharacterized protein (TIGR03435 family)
MDMKRLMSFGIVAVLTGVMVVAQTTTDRPAFEVAAIRPHDPADQQTMMVAQPGGRFTAKNIPLRMLIRTAYRLQNDQILGGPDWVGSTGFDIIAKAEGNAPPSDMLLMFQTLLAQRFKLAVRHDTRQLPVYSLVLARRDGRLGPQLRRNDCAPGQTPKTPPAPSTSPTPACGSISNGFGRLTIRAQ